jgi:hypothetical protein
MALARVAKAGGVETTVRAPPKNDRLGEIMMDCGTFTVRPSGLYWRVQAGDVVVHRAPSKSKAVTWAISRGAFVYVQEPTGKLVAARRRAI